MKSVLIGMAVMLLFYSCGPQILDNRRMLIEGTLLNAQGLPIPNEEILVKDYFEDDNPGFIGRTSGLLGETTTNADGSFSLITLITDSDIALVIESINQLENVFVIPNERTRLNEAIIIEDLILKQSAVVELAFVNSSGISNSFNAEISYHREFCMEQWSGDNFMVSILCPSITEFISNNNDNVVLSCVFPSTINVEYRDTNNQLVTEEFNVTSPNESYVINY